MTDNMIPADKVEEIINEMKKSMNEPAEGSFSAGYDNATSNWKRHLEALLPKPRTLADMTAEEGDFIIRGVAGEFRPCRSDIFAQTYQEVTND